MKNKYEIVGNDVKIYLPDDKVWQDDVEHFTVVEVVDLNKIMEQADNMTLRPFKNHAGRVYVGYKRHRDTTQTYLHRMLMDCPDGYVVDHKDGDPLNNRRSNLEIVTHQQNCMNRQGANKNNKGTGIRGVTKSGNVFRARVGQRHIGSFPTLAEAAQAVEKARGETNDRGLPISSTGRRSKTASYSKGSTV